MNKPTPAYDAQNDPIWATLDGLDGYGDAIERLLNERHATAAALTAAVARARAAEEREAGLRAALAELVETFHREAPRCSPGYTYKARVALGEAT